MGLLLGILMMLFVQNMNVQYSERFSQKNLHNIEFKVF